MLLQPTSAPASDSQVFYAFPIHQQAPSPRLLAFPSPTYAPTPGLSTKDLKGYQIRYEDEVAKYAALRRAVVLHGLGFNTLRRSDSSNRILEPSDTNLVDTSLIATTPLFVRKHAPKQASHLCASQKAAFSPQLAEATLGSPSTATNNLQSMATPITPPASPLDDNLHTLSMLGLPSDLVNLPKLPPISTKRMGVGCRGVLPPIASLVKGLEPIIIQKKRVPSDKILSRKVSASKKCGCSDSGFSATPKRGFVSAFEGPEISLPCKRVRTKLSGIPRR